MVFVHSYDEFVTFVWCYDHLNIELVIYIFLFVLLMNYRLLAHHVFLYAIIILTILNMLIMIKFCTVKCRTTDESWVSITDGFGQNSKLFTGMSFLMGLDIFYEFEFGMAGLDQ